MILILNPNSTESMTRAMLKVAQQACPTTLIEAWTSHDGPPAIQGPEDGEACIPPLLKLVQKGCEAGARAIIIGCFDDTGLDEASALATCPVIGIGQAAYHSAARNGGRFSVVTTLPVSTPILEANIKAYGLGGNLSKVRASGVPVLALETDPQNAASRVLQEIQTAQNEDNIQAVVLGCAGMSNITKHKNKKIKVKLIDGVIEATKAAEIWCV